MKRWSCCVGGGERLLPMACPKEAGTSGQGPGVWGGSNWARAHVKTRAWRYEARVCCLEESAMHMRVPPHLHLVPE
jgi:hypothetical protein